ncbi:MAG: NRDE family protein, partial [Halobacteria archaeon]|nr:NRDE family protein [Halobacteria archaeon]
MCTIILANQVFEDYTPVIAANRDEIYGRGSIPPRRTQIDDERWMIAPRDELAGGTWMGFNSDGILVGIANIWIQDGQSNDGDAYTSGEKMRSRGLLCDDVLRQTGLESARREIKESVSENEYNGFNLVVGSPKGAFGATSDGELRFVD